MQTYHITSVKDTTFEPDAYGNKFYSIEIEGVQGNLLWKTKNRPESGISVFGHTEPSKSGKSMIFKRDQKPDDYVEPAKPTYSQELLQGTPQTPVNASQPTNAQLMQAIEKLTLLVKEMQLVIMRDEEIIDPGLAQPPDEILSPDEEDDIKVPLSEIPF